MASRSSSGNEVVLKGKQGGAEAGKEVPRLQLYTSQNKSSRSPYGNKEEPRVSLSPKDIEKSSSPQQRQVL
jgi:hypothetical protein